MLFSTVHCPTLLFSLQSRLRAEKTWIYGHIVCLRWRLRDGIVKCCLKVSHHLNTMSQQFVMQSRMSTFSTGSRVGTMPSYNRTCITNSKPHFRYTYAHKDFSYVLEPSAITGHTITLASFLYFQGRQEASSSTEAKKRV